MTATICWSASKIAGGLALGVSCAFAQCPAVFIQAEHAVLTAPMIEGSNYIYSATKEQGAAEWALVLPSGQYTIWAHTIARDQAHDSFYVSFNGGPEDIWDLTLSTNWIWQMVKGRTTGNPRTFTLTGSDRLRFRAREPDALLDAIALSCDLAFSPTHEPPAPPSIAYGRALDFEDRRNPTNWFRRGAGWTNTFKCFYVEVSTNGVDWFPKYAIEDFEGRSEQFAFQFGTNAAALTRLRKVDCRHAVPYIAP